MATAFPPTLDLETLNAVLSAQSPSQIVSWSAATFSPDVVMSSSFGAESAALIHIAAHLLPEIRIIFIDTGYLFPETHQFLELLRRRFNLNIWTYRTRNDPIAYLQEASELDPQLRSDIQRCCAANKLEPFERAMRDLSPRAWLRGIRRQQASSRADRKVLEWSDRYNCYAISPLLNWSTRDLHSYMLAHDLPFHPLYEKGYLSIGCNPLTCTRPITVAADPRSGRWSGTTKTECGLHLEADGSGI